jgi:MoaA/NifB/PqqE/SkfB family radical SAM enzyme
MADTQTTREPETTAASSFRIDVKLHDVLMSSDAEERSKLEPEPALTLPEPVYPQRTYENEPTKDEYQHLNAKRVWNMWGKPYFASRSLQNRKALRPIIAYLFTEWKCNLSCHYCWAFDNRVKGMNEDVARRSIDWLHSKGNRVLALMGGEPLLRPQFVHKITDYAVKKDFFVYVPTNGRLMRPDVVDRLGDAGVSTFNIAIDAVKDSPELPKAFEPIKDYFEYCVKTQRKYGHTIAINTNICRNNMDDVKQLADIALDYGISIDFHINEEPMIEQEHFKDRVDDNATFLRKEDYSKVDDLLDWIIDRHRGGQRIVNPISHLEQMKDLMRGEVVPWSCRAGQNMLIIRMDGTLAPCFPMYSATHDWGVVGNDKFDLEQLDEMKKECSKHCLSTCNYILGFCYNTRRVVWWGLKQAMRGFKGVSGSF